MSTKKKEMKRFKKNLSFYGADFTVWPKEERQWGISMFAHSFEAQKAHEEEKRFESILEGRTLEAPALNLSQRISNAAIHQAQEPCKSNGLPVMEFLSFFGFSRPHLIVLTALIALILLTGFIIGYTNPFKSQTAISSNISEFLPYYNGEIL